MNLPADVAQNLRQVLKYALPSNLAGSAYASYNTVYAYLTVNVLIFIVHLHKTRTSLQRRSFTVFQAWSREHWMCIS